MAREGSPGWNWRSCSEPAESPESEREDLLSLFPATELKGWWQSHGKCVPIRSRTAYIHLAAAETLVSWHPHAIPDLLRTADYTRRLLAASATVPATELDERLRALQEMQELLRNGLDCTFYIHEVRHEALDVRVEVKDLHRPAVAVVG